MRRIALLLLLGATTCAVAQLVSSPGAMMNPADTQTTPAPPVPPGPLDLLIPGSLNGATTPYTNTYPVLHVRLACINAGGTAAPTITVSAGASPLTFIGRDTRAVAGQPLATAFYITGLTPGTRTITFGVSGGTVGNCAVRLGELVSQSGIGDVSDPSAQMDTDYYLEVYAGSKPGSPVTSQFGSIAVFANERAYSIAPSFDDDPQWSTWQTGMAARFATQPGPPGEGGDPSLLVYYTSNGASYRGAALVYEIQNAVLPP